jgi:hypothetical protein
MLLVEQQEIELIHALRGMHPEDQILLLLHAKTRAIAYFKERPKLQLVSITSNPSQGSTLSSATSKI